MLQYQQSAKKQQSSQEKRFWMRQKEGLCPVVLVLPRFTQASSDSPEGKYGKNSLESAQQWSWLNPLLFRLALFVAIGDCPMKQCYSSLTGFTGKAMAGRTYLA